MNWKEKKILLVEDQDRGDFFREYLEVKFGLNITWARDVEAAIGLSSDINYDLYILDVMMPLYDNSSLYEYEQKYDIINEYGMLTGLILLIKLHEMKNGKIKSILFSARGKEKIDEELENINSDVKYDAFVSKASDPIELYNTVESVLKKSL